jgi:hypothetical protein
MRHWIRPGRSRHRPLQCADRLLKSQPLHAQQVCRRALPIPDDGCKHDSAVYLRTPALACRGSSGLENSFQVMRNKDLGWPVGIATGLDLADVRRYFSRQPS